MPDLSRWQGVMAAVLGVVMAIGIAAFILDLLWLRRERRLDANAWREMGRSLIHLPPNALLGWLLAPAWAALFLFADASSPMGIEVTGWSIALAFLAVDFSYYWEHRCAHRVPWLWNAYHATHHRSPSYTVATAYRVNALNNFLAPAFYLPWVLIGFDPLLIVLLQMSCFHWQAWLHTESIGTLGPLDRWFNTPAIHRIHHSAATRHRDRNLGAVTLIWDRLFGTWAAPEARVVYGVAEAVGEARARGESR